ncbi:MAG: putative transcriptional regulatory protein [bacterium]|nr:MAG: putative transcriptional regulatory protein [bacterium]
MSGHSKWSTIKHKKAATDKKRGKLFSKVIKEITVAAKLGGGDLSSNPRLRTAVQGAKGANMPMDTVERAIKKGTGELPGTSYEEVTYEGYGPGGVAILISVTTDNKNRTVAEIRSLLGKQGGSMGETGCVNWMFEAKGYIAIPKDQIDESELMDLALEAGAEDLNPQDDTYEIITSMEDFEAVKHAVENRKLTPIMAELTMIPQTTVLLDEDKAKNILKLMEMLDDHDDVQKVYANFDIADEIMETLAGL